uniref:Uncharacterized protein n=1 Tax=Meloidogyne enterolobii TaxID=390850 RepID=A0A6V7WKS1_MELEN|nr:unnamed protein product [Meloidogyne enterolobii]
MYELIYAVLFKNKCKNSKILLLNDLSQLMIMYIQRRLYQKYTSRGC